MVVVREQLSKSAGQVGNRRRAFSAVHQTLPRPKCVSVEFKEMDPMAGNLAIQNARPRPRSPSGLPDLDVDLTCFQWKEACLPCSRWLYDNDSSVREAAGDPDRLLQPRPPPTAKGKAPAWFAISARGRPATNLIISRGGSWNSVRTRRIVGCAQVARLPLSLSGGAWTLVVVTFWRPRVLHLVHSEALRASSELTNTSSDTRKFAAPPSPPLNTTISRVLYGNLRPELPYMRMMYGWYLYLCAKKHSGVLTIQSREGGIADRKQVVMSKKRRTPEMKCKDGVVMDRNIISRRRENSGRNGYTRGRGPNTGIENIDLPKRKKKRGVVVVASDMRAGKRGNIKHVSRGKSGRRSAEVCGPVNHGYPGHPWTAVVRKKAWTDGQRKRCEAGTIILRGKQGSMNGHHQSENRNKQGNNVGIRERGYEARHRNHPPSSRQ